MSVSEHFTRLDWIVLFSYLGLIGFIGILFARMQTSTKEFFRAGKRMPWWAVGLSVVGSLSTGIGFLGHPARVFRHDSALAARMLSVMLVTPILMYVLLPLYCRLDVTTAYEYLEKRFGLNTRLLGSSLFIFKRLAWMALLTLAPALVLSTMTGITVEYCILIIGLCATLYTATGGLAAVIWTDVLQFIVTVVAQVSIIWIIIARLDGGASEFCSVAMSSGKAWASTSFDLSELTFWTMLISGLSLALSDNGVDQMSVQALMATKDEKAGRRVLLFNAFGKTPATLLLLAIGVGLWVFYQAFPERLNLEPHEIDKIVPYFIITELPPGLTGLVVAGIFAASMNGFDSGLNSIVACFTVDWYERIIRPNYGDARYLSVAKCLSFAVGMLITGLSIVIYRTGIESIIDRSNTMLGLFGGPLLGIFLLGAFTRRAHAGPTVVGTILAVVLLIAFDRWQSIMTKPILHSYLYSLIGCLLTMGFGYLGSCIFAPRRPGNLESGGMELIEA